MTYSTRHQTPERSFTTFVVTPAGTPTTCTASSVVRSWNSRRAIACCVSMCIASSDVAVAHAVASSTSAETTRARIRRTFEPGPVIETTLVSVLDERLQPLAAARVPELAERLCLDLADALAGDREVLAHL